MWYGWAMSAWQKVLLRLVLVLGGALATLLLTEHALRLLDPLALSSGYAIWQPNLRARALPRQDLLPGIKGESRITTNAQGFRGDPMPTDDREMIVTLGGSTTECLYLDDDEAWPGALQAILNRQASGHGFWVGNAGVSGHGTRHHLVQAEVLLALYPRIDIIVMLVGINDLLIRLRADESFVPLQKKPPEYKQYLVRKAFHRLPQARPRGLLEPAYLRKIVSRALQGEQAPAGMQELVLDDSGLKVERWREHRQDVKVFRAELPDLGPALAEYRANLERIVESTRRDGRKTSLVLMTQPTMWRAGLPRELSRLLWLGGIGPYMKRPGQPYYSVEVLAEAMGRYNKVTLDVCARHRLRCLDLDAILPKDTRSFYDDCHFNEGGARRVAEALARHLKQEKVVEP